MEIYETFENELEKQLLFKYRLQIFSERPKKFLTFAELSRVKKRMHF